MAPQRKPDQFDWTHNTEHTWSACLHWAPWHPLTPWGHISIEVLAPCQDPRFSEACSCESAWCLQPKQSVMSNMPRPHYLDPILFVSLRVATIICRGNDREALPLWAYLFSLPVKVRRREIWTRRDMNDFVNFWLTWTGSCCPRHWFCFPIGLHLHVVRLCVIKLLLLLIVVNPLGFGVTFKRWPVWCLSKTEKYSVRYESRRGNSCLSNLAFCLDS